MKNNNNNNYTNNNNLEKKQTPFSININNKNEAKTNILEKKFSVNNKYKKKLTSSLHFATKQPNLLKPINLNKFKSKKSDNINSAYNLMFKGRQFQYPTRVANKDNHDYFKQFFFLLLQSMKMNRDRKSVV